MLKNQHILITGGTSTLGETITRMCLQNKAAVSFTYYSQIEKAKQLETLGAIGYRVNFINKKETLTFTKEFRNNNQSLHVLINNAAPVADKLIKNMPEKDWDNVLQGSFLAPVILTTELTPLLKKSTPAKIINIISRVGQIGGFGNANYAAAKDALIEYTQYTAALLAPHKITVNALNPGFMISGMTKDLPKTILEKNKSLSLLETYSDPNEVAEFLQSLLLPQSLKVTGQIFHYETRK